MMNLKRGDVALVNFPHSDFRTIKLRPALVVQADNLGTGIPQIIVAMISSRLERAKHPCRVLIPLTDPGAVQTGLRTDSVIMTDNLATIRTPLINRLLGSLGDMGAVDRALRKTLAL
jgi:mRNA interferase MazF